MLHPHGRSSGCGEKGWRRAKFQAMESKYDRART
jgi:hypothetical protein